MTRKCLALTPSPIIACCAFPPLTTAANGSCAEIPGLQDWLLSLPPDWRCIVAALAAADLAEALAPGQHPDLAAVVLPFPDRS